MALFDDMYEHINNDNILYTSMNTIFGIILWTSTNT